MTSPTDLPLAATLRAECAKCAHIEVAWMAPNGVAFTLQAVVERRGRVDPEHKGWILTVPVYCQSDQLRAVEEVLDKVRSRHTEVLGSCVAYTFRPGAGWLDVYRKPEPRKAGASEAA